MNAARIAQMSLALALAAAAGLFMAPIAHAGTATLSWSANVESDLAGYKVYYGTSPRTSSCPPGGYPNKVTLGKTAGHTFENLADGTTYYFSVSAYDASGNESCFSAEKSKTVPPAGQGGAFEVGARVAATDVLNVRGAGSLGGSVLGSQAKGALGTIAGGPQSADSYIWWQVNYDTSPDGWSVQNYLSLVSSGGGNVGGSCTRLEDRITRYGESIARFVGRYREYNGEVDMRERAKMATLVGRDTERINLFETRTRDYLTRLVEAARTDKEEQAALTFQATVHNLLSAWKAGRLGALNLFNADILAALEAYIGSSNQAIGALEAGFANLAASVRASCNSSGDETQALAAFTTGYRGLTLSFRTAYLNARGSYRDVVREETSAKRDADRATQSAYTSGYRAAREAYLEERRG